MSIVRNFGCIALKKSGFKEEHVCIVCFTSILHFSLQNLYTLELSRSCWQNLELIKILNCVICRSVIMFVRHDIKQVTTKHPLVEINFKKSPTLSQIEAINAGVHMSAKSVLWYNEC